MNVYDVITEKSNTVYSYFQKAIDAAKKEDGIEAQKYADIFFNEASKLYYEYPAYFEAYKPFTVAANFYASLIINSFNLTTVGYYIYNACLYPGTELLGVVPDNERDSEVITRLFANATIAYLNLFQDKMTIENDPAFYIKTWGNLFYLNYSKLYSLNPNNSVIRDYSRLLERLNDADILSANFSNMSSNFSVIMNLLYNNSKRYLSHDDNE